jgi:glycosyltransferase involved in cell wall biosynthesis
MTQAVTFVIPVKRDARLLDGVSRLRSFLRTYQIKGEIISCGDMSGIAGDLGDVHLSEIPASKGRCVRKGVMAARGDIIIVVDADIPITDADVLAFIDAVLCSDLVVGSRLSSVNGACRPLIRRAAGAAFRAACWLFVGIRGMDVQCGAKALTRDAARRLLAVQEIHGLAYDAELLLRTRLLSMQVSTIRVHWTHTSSTIILWKHAPHMLVELLRLSCIRVLLARRMLVRGGA